MVGGGEPGRIDFDAYGEKALAEQLGIPEKEVEKECIDFEASDATIYLYSFAGKLNVVLFYNLRESFDSVLYICTSREEAFKVFREQTLLGSMNEYSGEEEEWKVQKILERYGLLDDLRIIFRIFEELSGEADLNGATNLVASKGLEIGIGYPSVSVWGEIEEQREYVTYLTYMLQDRDYLKETKPSEAWRIIKQIDF